MIHLSHVLTLHVHWQEALVASTQHYLLIEYFPSGCKRGLIPSSFSSQWRNVHQAATDGKHRTKKATEAAILPSDSYWDVTIASRRSLMVKERIRTLSLRYYPRIPALNPAVREFNEPQTSINGASRIPGMCGVCGGRHDPLMSCQTAQVTVWSGRKTMDISWYIQPCISVSFTSIQYT